MPERAGTAALFEGDLLYGAALYPEVWDAATFTSDAAHMRRLGMNTARIGEFMWSALEPEEGRIKLDVLDRALDTLAANGLRAIVCTPTVTPPVWLTHGHSERLHRKADGTVLGHGSRQHVCTNHPEFRRRAALITEAVARAIGDDDRVVAWQLDNEFKSHVGGCFCDRCRTLWTDWLRGRYREVSELNRRWISAVWSETYQAFEQVPLPGPTPFLHNSSLVNEFETFSKATVNAFAAEQAGIIRRFSSLPVTHNSGFGFSLENEELFADLDFSSFDTYPAASNYSAFLMNLDYFPRLGKAGRSVLMETSTSHSGSVARYGTAHPPGFVEAEAFACFASGAAGFLFWHFRQHRGGSEQPHGSVVSAWGAPTIGYAAAEAVGALRSRLAPLLEASAPEQPRVAITYSDRAKVFLATEPGDGPDYRSLLSAFHAEFVAAGIERDLLPEGCNLAGYRVLFTPFVHYLSASLRERILGWVREGGTWVAGPMTGDRTADHTWHGDSALGALEEAAGVRAVYQFPASGSGSIGRAFGLEEELGGMSTFVEPVQATVLGKVVQGPAAGLAFLTEHGHGDGKVLLLASMPLGQAMLRQVLDYACGRAVPERNERTGGDGVVDYPRRRDGLRQHWLVNMSGTAAEAYLSQPARDLITGAELAPGPHKLEPYEYLIAEELTR